jgi:hypothetical protein
MTRQIKNKAEIRALIRAEQAKWPACKNACFGDVCWQPADADGCNWKLSKMEGDNCEACLDAIMPFTKTLMADYNIPDENTR